MEVMEHVVRWVDPVSAVLSERRKNNKSLLREGLVPQIRLLNANTAGG